MKKIDRNHYKSFISQNKQPELLEKLLSELNEYLSGQHDDKIQDIYDGLIILNGRHESIKQEDNLGIIGRDEFGREVSKINHALLSLINRLPIYFFSFINGEKHTAGLAVPDLRKDLADIKKKSSFEYDAFFSFSSDDYKEAKKICDELRGYGLKVFLSDEALKANIGNSFFEKIDYALKNSQHFLLLSTSRAMGSEWVKTEYETFYNEYFIKNKGERRFIIFKGEGFTPQIVPGILRRLQFAESAKDIINAFLSDKQLEERKEAERKKAEQLKKEQEEKELAEKKKREQEVLTQQALNEKKKKDDRIRQQRILEEQKQQQKLKDEQVRQRKIAEEKALEEKRKQEAVEREKDKKTPPVFAGGSTGTPAKVGSTFNKKILLYTLIPVFLIGLIAGVYWIATDNEKDKQATFYYNGKMESAKKYFESGEYQLAEADYKAAANMMKVRGRNAYEAEQGVKKCQEAISNQNDNQNKYKKYIDEGDQLMKQKDYEKAKQYYLSAQKLIASQEVNLKLKACEKGLADKSQNSLFSKANSANNAIGNNPGIPKSSSVNHPAKNKFLGKHGITLQWISWDYTGTVEFVEKDGGIFVEGSQYGKGKQEGDYVKVRGWAEIINEKQFVLHGEVLMQVSHICKGQEAVRKGKLLFRSTSGRKYWRMKDMDTPCDVTTDYVDIYF